MHSPQVVTFGELLLRLDPPGFQRFIQADSFEARYTGAEANVAISLACFGMNAFVVSKVPDHEIGQSCINYLRRFGVDTSFIARGGNRLGVIYIETGASHRPSKVIYDRTHSSINDISTGELNWDDIFVGKHWFHFSGTAPALSTNVLAVLEEGLIAAHNKHLTISCDCNYRSKLWSTDEAGRVLSRLLPYVDVFLGGIDDTEKIFGISLPESLQDKPNEAAEYSAQRLAEMFNISWVAMPLRHGSSASNNLYTGMVFHDNHAHFSREYDVDIIDRIGAGDAFAAGIIYQILSENRPEDVIEFATAAACLKHTIIGDFNLSSLQEVFQLVNGYQSSRVQR